MKQIISEIKFYLKRIGAFFLFLFGLIKRLLKRCIDRIKQLWICRRLKAFFESDRYRAVMDFLNKHVVIAHIILSLTTCFILEWLSRHSFGAAVDFVVHRTGQYLFNTFLIFVVYSPVFLMRRRTFLRMVIVGVFIVFGVSNCLILLNRVTPFGFTDLYMITDLLTMQGTQYFTRQEAAISVVAMVIYVSLMVLLFRKCNRQEIKTSYTIRLAIVVALFVSIPFLTKAAIRFNIMTSYFGNLAQGYLDYGYVYGFATSAFDRGMSKPFGYNQENIKKIVTETDMGPSTIADKDKPNIIVILLESFYDVDEATFIETSEDPIPYFHELESKYSTGHLTVPVVGAGTCNTEFEILTGLSCLFFGPGEYPQKTILKKRNVESFASDLKTLGYSTAVVHNNGGNFYSRANAFSKMGFDEFTAKELVDITEYTPLGSWPTDDILIGATKDVMDATEGKDFVYTITVEGHGNYPTEKIIEDPAIKVTCEGKDEEKTNMWEYYINMIHNVDEFIREYTEMLDARGEDTLVIMFGDHLPTMGLNESETATGDLYQTKYATWNNFGMPKEDADLTSYQLVAMYLDRLGIHDGTVVDYHQSMVKSGENAKSNRYMNDLEMLQYDLLYGKRYAYGGVDLYPANEIVMGIKDIRIDRVYKFADKIHIYGDNFTNWSRVYVNGEKVSTTYESGQCLTIDADAVTSGDILTVNQNGSSSTVFRSSNAYAYYDPYYVPGEAVPAMEEAAVEEEAP